MIGHVYVAPDQSNAAPGNRPECSGDPAREGRSADIASCIETIEKSYAFADGNIPLQKCGEWIYLKELVTATPPKPAPDVMREGKGPQDCAEFMLLQARPAEGGDWTNIYAAQLRMFAKNGHDVRAVPVPSPDGAAERFLQIGGAGNPIGWGVNKIEVRERTTGEGWAWRYITEDEKAFLLECFNNRASATRAAEPDAIPDGYCSPGARESCLHLRERERCNDCPVNEEIINMKRDQFEIREGISEIFYEVMPIDLNGLAFIAKPTWENGKDTPRQNMAREYADRVLALQGKRK